MSKAFEELDFQKTPMGELSLRRRRVASLDGLEVFEVKLGESFLMSSMFHEVEVALASLGLAGLGESPLDVVVGGLGLGYTAVSALSHKSVRSLLVIDALEAVIGWHRRNLVPLGATLTGDSRCRLIHGDFFAMSASPAGFDPEESGRRFHAVLLDVDHSPSRLLNAEHGSFYHVEGLKSLAAHLLPDGAFALWSDDAPEETFLGALGCVFAQVEARVVHFENPLLECQSSSTVYLARAGERS